MELDKLEKRKKSIVKCSYIWILILFLLFALQIDVIGGEEKQEEIEKFKCSLSTTITVKSDKDLEFEIKFFTTNVSSTNQKLRSSFKVPLYLGSFPEAKWSTLDGTFWHDFELIDLEENNLMSEIKDNFYKMRRKKEVILKPAQKDGFRIKYIKKDSIGEINGNRGFVATVFSGGPPIYTNTLVVKIPLKRGLFHKLSYID